MGIETLIGAGASLIGAGMQSRSSSKAADAQSQASAAAIAEQRRQYDLTRGDYAPYRNTGRNALQQLEWELGISPIAPSGTQKTEAQIRSELAPRFTRAGSQGPTTWIPGSGGPDGTAGYWAGPEQAQPGSDAWFQMLGVGPAYGMPGAGVPSGGASGGIDQGGLDQAVAEAMAAQGQGSFTPGPSQRTQDDLRAEALAEPGYQFGLQQGQQALDRKRAAAGGRISGASLKAAQQFGTDYAATGYNAAYQRRQDRLSRLQTLAGLGQSSTSGSAAAGQNSTNAISSILQNRGDNAGSAALNQGNIWADTTNQLGAIFKRNQQQPATYTTQYDPNYNGSGAMRGDW